MWSDEWAAYRRVQHLPNVNGHATVYHSIQFVDQQTGVHTQAVESYWNRVKIKLKRMRGCHEHQLPSYLDELMYWERYGGRSQQMFNAIFTDIAAQYPV